MHPNCTTASPVENSDGAAANLPSVYASLENMVLKTSLRSMRIQIWYIKDLLKDVECYLAWKKKRHLRPHELGSISEFNTLL